MKLFLTTTAALALAACSGGTDTPDSGTANQAAPVQNVATPAPAATAQPAPPAATTTATPTPAPAVILALEGLGDLRIGQPVPRGSSWAERGAQTGEACRTVSSPSYPGAYAIVEGGTVRRITVGQNATVKLAEGIGPGATEAAVRKAFPSFEAEPHKYESAPAKYLTAPNAAGSESALRFEINHAGKVGAIHVGTMPTLAYVEGCA